jgi:hypothetical protein
MQKLANIDFSARQTEIPAEGLIREFFNVKGETLQLYIGTETTACSIQIQAKVAETEEFFPVVAINDSTMSMVSEIIAPGIYKVDISGYDVIQLKIASSVGNLICKGIVLGD